MFHFDPTDDLCPSYLQRDDRKTGYNTGAGSYKTNDNCSKAESKKVNATSA